VTADGSLIGVITGDTVIVSAAAAYADASAGEDKSITISYTLSGADAANYTISDDTSTTASISKAAYDMSGISFEDASVTYDGNPHALQISGTLPSDVSVSYSNESHTETGTYEGTAHFTGVSMNYEAIDDLSATLTINGIVMSGSITITGTPVYGETLTADPDLTDAGTPTYQWYRGSSAISGAIGTTYTLVSADIGSTITITATAGGANYQGSITSPATASISKSSGTAISSTILGYYPSLPSDPTIINFTGFDQDLEGVEARVALNGSTFGSYADIEIDSRGRAMIVPDADATTAAKVQFRMKETDTTYAGPVKEIAIAEAALSIGDYYEGGVVGYIYSTTDTGYVSGEVHGLIAAKEDSMAVSPLIKWSDDITTAIGTEITMGTGAENTDKIIAELGPSAGSYAAGAAHAHTGGGYTDWFLPSWDELKALQDSRLIIGNFVMTSDSTYWTSSESTQGDRFTPEWCAHSVLFDGQTKWWVNDKTDQMWVRAVRYF
jgi:trimeric autotransporter adhesin